MSGDPRVDGRLKVQADPSTAAAAAQLCTMAAG